MSESLARQNPQSPFRRAPSSIPHHQHEHGGATGPLSLTTDTQELLKIARDNIENLKSRGRRVN